jgi:predicted nucleotide-binding protein (sugar kinase/HSP70/actin superfamily)
MRNYKNNNRRNRFRKNGSKQNHQKDNGHKTISDFSNNFNYRPRNQWKNNQNASKLIEKYNNLAREALSNGDKILSESYFQHADHFVRILGEKDILKENLNNKIGLVQDLIRIA